MVKKGPYLFIPRHYGPFCFRNNYFRHCVIFAVRMMGLANTGSYIRKLGNDALGEWEILRNKVLASLT